MGPRPRQSFSFNREDQGDVFRDKSLLMPGRGPEEIFMNSKNFS
jgi:hypothetical protein